MSLICDTGVLLAALDGSDPDHEECAKLLRDCVEDLIIPGLVLAELDYWCRKLGLLNAWAALMEDVESGAWTVEWPTRHELTRASQLQQTYADLSLGVVDATVMALAERLHEHKVASLDHRHFSVVRPRHVPALVILPG